MTRERQDPQTAEEWQEAVDAAHFYLLLDSAFQYGLVKYPNGGTVSDVDVDRCQEIIEKGKAEGYTPSPMAGCNE